MRKVLVIIVVTLFLAATYLPMAIADEGMHFHCSVCGSHNHGSMWHDSNKDGTNDR